MYCFISDPSGAVWCGALRSLSNMLSSIKMIPYDDVVQFAIDVGYGNSYIGITKLNYKSRTARSSIIIAR